MQVHLVRHVLCTVVRTVLAHLVRYVCAVIRTEQVDLVRHVLYGVVRTVQVHLVEHVLCGGAGGHVSHVLCGVVRTVQVHLVRSGTGIQVTWSNRCYVVR